MPSQSPSLEFFFKRIKSFLSGILPAQRLQGPNRLPWPWDSRIQGWIILGQLLRNSRGQQKPKNKAVTFTPTSPPHLGAISCYPFVPPPHFKIYLLSYNERGAFMRAQNKRVHNWIFFCSFTLNKTFTLKHIFVWNFFSNFAVSASPCLEWECLRWKEP